MFDLAALRKAVELGLPVEGDLQYVGAVGLVAFIQHHEDHTVLSWLITVVGVRRTTRSLLKKLRQRR